MMCDVIVYIDNIAGIDISLTIIFENKSYDNSRESFAIMHKSMDL